MKKSIVLTVLVVLFCSTNLFSQTKKQVKVHITTEYGKMTAILYNETPKHRDNFVKLVKEGWYNNSPFHRVIKNFMIQGGQNADGRLIRVILFLQSLFLLNSTKKAHWQQHVWATR